jgi:hypothetical protein
MVNKNCSQGDGGLQLVFAGECEVNVHTHLAKVWQKKGHPMNVMTVGDDHKFTVYGGFEYQVGNIISYQAAGKDSKGIYLLVTGLNSKPYPISQYWWSWIMRDIIKAVNVGSRGSNSKTVSALSPCQLIPRT